MCLVQFCHYICHYTCIKQILTKHLQCIFLRTKTHIFQLFLYVKQCSLLFTLVQYEINQIQVCLRNFQTRVFRKRLEMNKKILFFLFDSFLYVESSPTRLFMNCGTSCIIIMISIIQICFVLGFTEFGEHLLF